MFSGKGYQWVVILVINKLPLLNWFQNTLGARGCPVTLLTRIPKTICPPEHVPLAETQNAFLTQETQPEEEQRERREGVGEIMPVQNIFQSDQWCPSPQPLLQSKGHCLLLEGLQSFPHWFHGLCSFPHPIHSPRSTQWGSSQTISLYCCFSGQTVPLG